VEEEEFVVIHDERGFVMKHHATMSSLRWTLTILPLLVMMSAMTCCGAAMMLRNKKGRENEPLLNGKGQKVEYGV